MAEYCPTMPMQTIEFYDVYRIPDIRRKTPYFASASDVIHFRSADFFNGCFLYLIRVVDVVYGWNFSVRDRSVQFQHLRR